MQRRSLVLAMFIAATLLSLGILVFTDYNYFRLYSFKTLFRVEVKRIQVGSVNQTHASVDVLLSLENPSDVNTSVTYVKMQLEREGQLVIDTNSQLEYHPLNLSPFSSVNFSFSGICLRELVGETPQRTWTAYFTVSFKGVPILPKITVSNLRVDYVG